MSSKNETFLSIIIPNYNSGKLLRRCLESILVVNKDNYEVIVVDDGSTDNSLSLLPEDPHIRLIRQKNEGVASARNTGMNNADAEYLMFVDADDTLNKNWYSVCSRALAEDSDLVIFNYYSGHKLVELTAHRVNYKAGTTTSFVEKALKNPTKYMTVWGKMFKRQVVVENGLTFNQTLRLAEDGDFLLKYLFMVSKVEEVPDAFYHYQNNVQSVMHTFDNNKVQGYLVALSESRKTIAQQKNYRLEHWFSFYILMHLNVMLVHEVFDVDNSHAWKSKLGQLKRVLNQPIIQQALKDVKLTECNSIRTVPIMLLKLHMYSLAGALYTTRSKQNHQ